MLARCGFLTQFLRGRSAKSWQVNWYPIAHTPTKIPAPEHFFKVGINLSGKSILASREKYLSNGAFCQEFSSNEYECWSCQKMHRSSNLTFKLKEKDKNHRVGIWISEDPSFALSGQLQKSSCPKCRGSQSHQTQLYQVINHQAYFGAFFLLILLLVINNLILFAFYVQDWMKKETKRKKEGRKTKSVLSKRGFFIETERPHGLSFTEAAFSRHVRRLMLHSGNFMIVKAFYLCPLFYLFLPLGLMQHVPRKSGTMQSLQKKTWISYPVFCHPAD